MKWWGWGQPDHYFDLAHAPAAWAYLESRLGPLERRPRFTQAIDAVKIPPSGASGELLAALSAAVGAENCRSDHRERVWHSAGKGYLDLLRLRSLKLDEATDAVVYPRDEAQVAAVVGLCREQGVALIPFGGGTSVVQGLAPCRGPHATVITLDLAHLNRVVAIDESSLTAQVEAGCFGPELERALGTRGFVLGHYPQSFEFSTLGGWLATRSSGQNCLRYGGIERLVESIRVVTPVGTLETLRVPRRGDGPDLTQMLVGSEGTYGVIVSATMRIRHAPASQDYFMVAFKSFREAAEACRTMVQAGLAPALLRASDEEETHGTLALGHTPAEGLAALSRRAAKWLLARRGFLPPRMALVLVGLEGTTPQTRQARRAVREHLRRYDCFYLGTSAGQRWLSTRFELPYLRDELLDQGLLIDTLETSTTWDRLCRLYDAVRSALEQAAAENGWPLVVYAHISHLYPDGASLYFTLLGRQATDDPVGQWRTLKLAANRAIREQQAVISHHHGVGLDHREHTGWSEPERAMLRNLKSSLDPAGVMNPGKLL